MKNSRNNQKKSNQDSKSKKETKTQTRSILNTVDATIYVEAFGLILFALGVMLFLAILTYSQSDPVMGGFSGNNNYDVQNLLGPVGATIAKPLFDFTLGYASLVFPILMMIYGVFIMINRPVNVLTRLSILSLGWAYFASIVMAIPESLSTFGFSQNYYPSGLIGAMTSDLIAKFLGRFALGFLTTVYLLILLMLTFEFRLSLLPGFVGKTFQTINSTLQNILSNIKNGFRRLIGMMGGIQWLPERITRHSSKSNTGDILTENEPVVSDPKPVDINLNEDVSDFSDGRDITLNNDRQADLFDYADKPFTKPVEPTDREVSATDIEFPLPEGYYAPKDDLEDIPFVDQLNEVEKIKPQTVENYDELVRQAAVKYQPPTLDLLDEDESQSKISREELMANADRLENTLGNFNVKAFVKKVIEGPVITLYAVRPAEGVKISQITNLADDLALSMKAKGIRMIAPIPGEAAIGIEIPNRKPSIVYFKTVMRSEKFRNHPGQLVLGMGKTIGGEVFCADLTRMPHLLIAGSTGSGKSVGINTIIASIIYRVPPSDVKFVMIDPKKLELSLYAKLKDHYLAYCPDIDEIVITHPQNAILVLRSVVNEMEERYDLLAKMGVRDIISYNKKIEKIQQADSKSERRRLPYLVVIIDELADLILTASREVEEPITRLAQMARAVGIHLIVATQRPSVDILTGLIKANFPTRIAFQVATRPDSKVILDMYGAEKLIGNGDMLYLPPGTGKPVRLQNPFLSTEEVENMIKHVRKQPKFPPYVLKLVRENKQRSAEATKLVNRDELFEKAKEIVIRHQQGSTSLLQRKLNIGYARAGRLMDSLEEAGIVGPSQGSKAREVLFSSFGDNEN